MEIHIKGKNKEIEKKRVSIGYHMYNGNSLIKLNGIINSITNYKLNIIQG